MNTLAVVQRILADQTGIGVEDLQPLRPLEQLGVDSLVVTETMFLLEDEFKVQMPGAHVPIRTVQDLADVVDHLVRIRDAAMAGAAH